MAAKLFSDLIKEAPTPSAVHLQSSNTGVRRRRQPRDDEPPEWSTTLKIAKVDVDKRQMFGWASIIEKDGRPIIDKQGDIIEAEELEGAAYDFALYSRSQGDLHTKRDVGRLIESMVFTVEKQKALGINLGQVGWWVGFQVDDPDLWEAHKRGDRQEFSIGGTAQRVEV